MGKLVSRKLSQAASGFARSFPVTGIYRPLIIHPCTREASPFLSQNPKAVAAIGAWSACIVVRVSKPRKSRKVKPWTVEEAQQFLASAREADDSLYAAYVLILVLGLRLVFFGSDAGREWSSFPGALFMPLFMFSSRSLRIGREWSPHGATA